MNYFHANHDSSFNWNRMSLVMDSVTPQYPAYVSMGVNNIPTIFMTLLRTPGVLGSTDAFLKSLFSIIPNVKFKNTEMLIHHCSLE